MKKKTRALILGSTGMLGHMVMKILMDDKDLLVHGTNICEEKNPFYFNVEHGIEGLNIINKAQGGYDYFINCIGILTSDVISTESRSIVRAIEINSIFPHRLSEYAKEQGARVIHMSTDGVFSGEAKKYDEEAPCDCVDIYGKTKSLGEVNCRNVLNIRCSIVGPSPIEKRGLFEWFRSQPDGGSIKGYTNHIWTGVTTQQYAELCHAIVRKGCFDEIRDESPVHHFCPNNPISKFELLKVFQSVTQKPIEIMPCEDSKGAIRRILDTKYRSLTRLFGRGKDISSEMRGING